MDSQINSESASRATGLRPFYWACGKCHSRGLYREDDRLVGDFSIACKICGNRYYGDVGSHAQCKTKGLAPVKIYHLPTDKTPDAFALEWPTRIPPDRDKDPEKPTLQERKKHMAKAKIPCSNCKRTLTVVSAECCFLCYTAQRGLEGEERAAALAAVKARIERGEVKKRGGGSAAASRKEKPAAPADPSSTRAKKTEGDADQETSLTDCVVEFVKETCDVKDDVLLIPSYFDRHVKLYNAYRLWCADNGCRPATANRFSTSLISIFPNKGIRLKKEDSQLSGTSSKVEGLLAGRSLIILSDQELRLIQALRAGSIAIIP